MEEILREGFAELGIAPPEDAAAKFRGYYERLAETGSVMNLTAIEGEGPVARLHFLDSAALLSLADFSGRRVIDVGTGAGFPGMPLAILRPDAQFTLLDSQEKRMGFLSRTLEELGVANAACACMRAEEAPGDWRGSFDIAVSRAVARLNVLCELCLPFVKVGGLFIAMKAEDCARELEEARNAAEVLGGAEPELRRYRLPGTDIVRAAVLIKKLRPTPEKYPRRWAKISRQPL